MTEERRERKTGNAAKGQRSAQTLGTCSTRGATRAPRHMTITENLYASFLIACQSKVMLLGKDWDPLVLFFGR